MVVGKKTGEEGDGGHDGGEREVKAFNRVIETEIKNYLRCVDSADILSFSDSLELNLRRY